MADAGLKLGIVAGTLSADPREAVRLARTSNIDGLLFDAISPALTFHELSATGRREFRHVLSSQNRQLIGLRAEWGPKGLRPGADVDRILATMDRVMEAAAGLEARFVSVDVGPLPPAPAEQKPAKKAVTQEQAGLILLPTFAAAPAPEITDQSSTPPNIDPIFAAQVEGALSDLGRRADRYGVTVAIRSDLSPFSALGRALHSANCPCFGVELCPVSILRDDWAVDEIFSRLGSSIRHVRARDAVKGSGQRTQPAIVGQGNTNWAELLALLDDAGYHGWITLDPTELTDRARAIQLGLKHLRELR